MSLPPHYVNNLYGCTYNGYGSISEELYREKKNELELNKIKKKIEKEEGIYRNEENVWNS